MNRLAFVCMAIAVVANDSSLQAGMLTYIFRSEISSKTDPYYLIDNISLGDEVTYVVNVDTEAENLSYVPDVGYYMSLSTVLNIGGICYETGRVRIEVWSDNSENPTSSFSIPITFETSSLRGAGYFELVDFDKSGIGSPSLLASPYDLRLFEMRDFEITTWDPRRYGVDARVSGTVQSFSVIPEPCSLALAGSYAFWFPSSRRRARYN